MKEFKITEQLSLHVPSPENTASHEYKTLFLIAETYQKENEALRKIKDAAERLDAVGAYWGSEEANNLQIALRALKQTGI